MSCRATLCRGLLMLGGLMTPAVALSQGVSIDHQAVGCVLAEKFPRFDARLDPAGDVARVRLNFRPDGGVHWYYVEMKPEAGVFHGILPKPQKTLHRFSYYIDVTDKAFQASRTAEFTLDVASGPAACSREKVLAPGLAKAEVVVHGPQGVPGAPSVPAGFGSEGVLAAGAPGAGATAAAAAGTTAGAVAATAGGVGAKALILGGVAVAGAAAAVVATTGGDEDGTPSSSAAVGNYVLEQIDGAPLPVLVIPTPCDGFVDSGTLRLESDQDYTMTETTRFECLNGPGPVNPHSETGRWSESGGVISFAANPPIFNLSTGTLAGNTLTLPMDILSEGVGVPPIRVTSTWRKQ